MLYPKFSACLAPGRVGDSNGSHPGLGKNDAPMSLPLGPGPMPGHVCDVFRVRAPAQIFQAVVSRVAVEVSALHARGTRTDERFKHKVMYEAEERAGIEPHLKMTVNVHPLRLQFPPVSTDNASAPVPMPQAFDLPPTPDCPIATDSIGGEVLNFSERNVRLALRHGGLPEGRFVQGGRRTQPACPPSHSSKGANRGDT